jgi:hypothetical protein
MSNEKGGRIIDSYRNAPKDMRPNLILSASEWLKRFKGEAVDYLLEKHSLDTLRTLEQFKDSNFLKTILEVDGPV